MNMILRERRLQTVEDTITNTTAELRAIQQTSIEDRFKKLQRRWEQRITAQGNCFE
jgi:hypothetical protein